MKTLRRTALAAAAVLALGLSLTTVGPLLATEGMSEGTIRKIDAGNGKVTIKHGPLDNLAMPPMTMVFTVTDPAMLASFAKGDEIEFVAAEEGGKFVVKELRAVR